MNPRSAIALGVTFVAVGLIYWWVQQYDVNAKDYQGFVLLVVLGVAMAFAFTVLVRGSRDL